MSKTTTTIKIKNIWGNILYSHEAEDNSVKKALRAAIESGSNLRGSDLSDSDLSGSDLRDCNLSGCNLFGSDLSGSDLSGSDLRGCNLSDCNLSDSDLRGSDLSRSDLSGCNLVRSNLSGCNLVGSDLSGCNLNDCNLRGSDLRDSDLRGCNLNDCNLRGSDLRDSDLRGSDLRAAKNAEWAIAATRILPEGSIIGWKKCRDNVIVKLRIPEEAKRSHAFGRKCRAEFADVIEIFGGDRAISKHDGTTEYIVGERVTPDNFDDDWTNECAGGIHFFITREEAERY